MPQSAVDAVLLYKRKGADAGGGIPHPHAGLIAAVLCPHRRQGGGAAASFPGIDHLHGISLRGLHRLLDIVVAGGLDASHAHQDVAHPQAGVLAGAAPAFGAEHIRKSHHHRAVCKHFDAKGRSAHGHILFFADLNMDSFQGQQPKKPHHLALRRAAARHGGGLCAGHRLQKRHAGDGQRLSGGKIQGVWHFTVQHGGKRHGSACQSRAYAKQDTSLELHPGIPPTQFDN